MLHIRSMRLWHLAPAGATLVAVLLASSPPGHGGAPPCRSPEVRVHKGAGTVELVCAGQVRASYPATFGASPVGPKLREGDERTPEGVYRITSKVASKRFHRFLGISYPNAEDRARARAAGITRLGGGIGIHGSDTRLAPAARAFARLAQATSLHRWWGPTDGCVGMLNEDVDALWATVPIGTKVVIAP